MYRRILVPVDGSPTARRGLDEAIRLARQTGASLRLFHAIDDPFTALGIDEVVQAPRDVEALLAQNARRIVDEGMAASRLAGVYADSESKTACTARCRTWSPRPRASGRPT